jgi:hypothetical protein
MTTTCINLKARFGKTHRITFDEAYDHHGVHRSNLDAWMMQIPCQRGTIYPQGGDMLAVEIDYRGPTARAVGALPGVRCHQDGDNEKTFVFHVDLFDQVAAIVKPRRRRVVSEEQRQRLAAMAAQHGFKPSVACTAPSATTSDAA